MTKNLIKLISVFGLAVIVLFGTGTVSVINRPVVKEAEATFTPTKYPDPKEIVCVEGQTNIEDNQKFTLKVGGINVAYRWHIQSQDSDSVTFRLQVDINPTNNETWINVAGNITKTLDIPNCEPQPCDELDLPEIALDRVIIPCITPTATPSATPTPTDTPKEQGGGGGVASTTEAPQCGKTAPTQVGANFHVYRNGDTAIAKWFPTGGNKANIYYKQVDSADWQYAVRDIDNNGYFVINGLGSLDITFALQQSNDCAGGALTQYVVDGVSDTWVLFR